ncbi:MAG: methionyl-tRNA formyltransferase [Eubacteriales bacterium]|nr:methionyl-tRNA formyltransferase [Eubacteriales bacterium]
MRVVFMGTPEYAANSLSALIAGGHEVAAVFTQPDRPRGRGGKVQEPPVKILAKQHGIPVYQPRRIRLEGVEALRELSPALCVTAAFGQILSQEILDIPAMGTVNVHASLLPKYRGSSPAHWAIINGERETGVTTMMTDAGIDTGDILLQARTGIKRGETAGELTDRLAILGADLLIQTIDALAQGNCPREKQDEGSMSHYPLLSREHGRIDWRKPAGDIVNLIHGLNPWPSAYSDSPWGQIKIHRAEATYGLGAPGEILLASTRDGLMITAGSGAVRVKAMQAPGGRIMAPEDFLRGHPMPAGTQRMNGEA